MYIYVHVLSTFISVNPCIFGHSDSAGSVQTLSSQEQIESLAPILPTTCASSPLPPACDPCTPEPLKTCLGQQQNNSTSLGSVEGFRLNSPAPGPVFLDAAAAVSMPAGSFKSLDSAMSSSQCTFEPLELDRSPATTSRGVESFGSTGPSTPSFHINLGGQSRVIVSPLVVEPSSKIHHPIDGNRSSPKGPSVLVQPLNRLAETIISQSPLLQFATNSLGHSFTEKNM